MPIYKLRKEQKSKLCRQHIIEERNRTDHKNVTSRERNHSPQELKKRKGTAILKNQMRKRKGAATLKYLTLNFDANF